MGVLCSTIYSTAFRLYGEAFSQFGIFLVWPLGEEFLEGLLAQWH
jgi:hypothetical protein